MKQDIVAATDQLQKQLKSPNKRMQAFQQQFFTWLGPEPNKGTVIVAERSGYSLDYVRWAAGLIGKQRWPGSRKFIKAMAKLGCSNKKWRDRSPEELRRALRFRETLYDPLITNPRGLDRIPPSGT